MRFFDAFVNDLNTVERGKRIDRANIAGVFTRGMPLPGSMFALDIEGGTVEATGLGFADGDADRPCMPIPGTLVPVPWQPDVAQVQLTHVRPRWHAFLRRSALHLLDERAGAIHAPRPDTGGRHRIRVLPGRCASATRNGQPQPPKGPLTGRREFRTQINSMTDLNEYSPLLAEIDRVCRLQNVPTTSALAEYGPGQYEVNLAHAPDALRVCDEALRFKRIVKSVARAHGCEATFLPKPYRDMAGSGLHVHVSLLDAAGRNIFAAAESARQRAAAPRDRRHARRRSRDGMALCAPGPNSYRRFRTEAYVPLHPDLVHQQSRLGDPRAGLGPRQPAHRASTRRRRCESLPGARLGARRHAAWTRHASSSRRRCSPAMPIEQDGRTAADSLGRGHRAFRAQRIRAAATSATKFVNLFATVKRAEMEEFNSHVTPLEIARYLGPL